MKTPGRLFKRRGTYYFLLVSLFAVTWVIPGTRETQAESWTLVKRIFLGQFKPSFFPVTIGLPNPQLEGAAQARLLANAGRSPDDYIAATAITNWPTFSPAADSWRDHPLLPWAAFKYATDHHSQERANRTGSNSRSNSVTTEQVLRILDVAQSRLTNNGALWLAEAYVQFDLGNADLAIAALKQAVLRKEWDAHRHDSFRRLSAQYERSGLSRVDAAIVACRNAGFAHLEGGVAMQLSSQLSTNFADTERSSEYFHLAQQLRRIPWRDRVFESLYKNSYAIRPGTNMPAMARFLGRGVDPNDEGAASRTAETREVILRDYLVRLVGSDAADRHFNEVAERASAFKERFERDWHSLAKPALRHYIFLSIGSILLMVVTAFVALHLLIEGISRLVARMLDTESTPWRRALIPAIVSAMALLAGYAVLQGISSEAEATEADQTSPDVFGALIFAAAWLQWAFLTRKQRPPVWLYVGPLYLMLVIATAIERENFIHHIGQQIVDIWL